MKTIIAFLFRLAYRKELKQIYESQEQELLDTRNQGFVESMVTNQSVRQQRDILKALNLLD